MFAMVTVIGTLIFVFSLGYMRDETKETVADHEVDRQTPVDHGPLSIGSHHFHRRGRFGRFFLYLSLFCFSMLNLVIADNLFQVFVSWELVGVCSFFLIGFYYERPSASVAANKAFIVNRIGDAGFLVGMLIAWTYFGTLNFEDMFHRARAPAKDSHGKYELASQIIRVNPSTEPPKNGAPQYELPPRDQLGTGQPRASVPARLGPSRPLPRARPRPAQGRRSSTSPRRPTTSTTASIPYWLFVVMGVGIFLGCVGKSAQVPLHTWLPDAMEGPTPVSALIHAATMVAAGVYLVGRVLPAVRARGAARHRLHRRDHAVPRAPRSRSCRPTSSASSPTRPCSQLGFMMLALGVGGWVAGLLHLITHAFFKALLFLGSGSVIHGCHHEQDLRKMGGLSAKMPMTAFTMLVGVLAISGTPLFSGWYSKDHDPLGARWASASTTRSTSCCSCCRSSPPGMTAFYMFRLWFLTFAGTPRDQHVHEHAHESPPVMTRAAHRPRGRSASASPGAGRCGTPTRATSATCWRSPSRPRSTLHFAPRAASRSRVPPPRGRTGAGSGARRRRARVLVLRPNAADRPRRCTRRARRRTAFLLNKWYFDEAYDAALVQPDRRSSRRRRPPPTSGRPMRRRRRARPNCRRSGSTCSRSTAS